MECSVEGCIRGAFRIGLCTAHYDKDRRDRLGPCSIEGCEEPTHGNGLCSRHYRAAKLVTAPRCGVLGCNRGVIATGLCTAHYNRQRKRGDLQPTRPDHWGAKVKHPLYHTWAWQKRGDANHGVAEEWSDFWRFVEDVGERPTPQHKLRRPNLDLPLGPGNFEWRLPIPVVESANNKEWRASWAREYRARHPTRHRNTGFKRRYGIDYAQYQTMSEAQGGLCLICKKPETSLNQHTHEPRLLSVDHCHSTGRIRGLLCKRCNTGIGAFEEDPELLKAAVRYVRRHKTLSDES